jgi:phenylacetate-coenzyme A ligase PaaK-like adenylate-forming protein
MTAALDVPAFGVETEARVLSEFRRAAADVPAYRVLLDEHGVDAEDVSDLASFRRLCPLLSKTNTFDRFGLEQLSVGGALLDIADVLTSSGHGGRFSFGVISRQQLSANAEFMDQAFDAAFSVKRRKTLTINCLPMGVVFSSHCMTVATTSVREDMAVALVETFGHHYEQIVICGDPLFLKRFTDYARERGVDWSRYRVNAMIGEEIFGERYREYLADSIGLDVDRPGHGSIVSSFGVGELGLHLGYETQATLSLRRAALANAGFARDVLGAHPDDGATLPMIFTFNPLRTFIEVVDPDRDGYGRMTTSMLDAERTVPLLRYQTGDIVRLLDLTQVTEAARQHGVALSADLPRTLLALRGREKEALPNGSHVGFYKDVLYADRLIARCLTGAFRMTFSDAGCTMHVQLGSSQIPPASVEQSILDAMPSRVRPARLVVWPYSRFPFGMSLDYERKFVHYVPGEPDPSDRS